MSGRRVPRLPSLVGTLGLAIVLGLAFVAVPAAQAQRGADAGPGPMGPGMRGAGPGLGPRGGPNYGTAFGEVVVPGQTQVCSEYPGAVAEYSLAISPGLYYDEGSWAAPFGPWGWSYYGYNGFWGYYANIGPVCLWRPR